MGGSNTTSQQGSSQSVNEIPQWVQNAGQQNYGLAQAVASQPLQQYQGQMVADVAPQTQQAWNTAANSGNVGMGAQNAAQAGYLNTLGQTPQQVTAAQMGAGTQATLADPVKAQQAATAQLSSTGLSNYMNPYTQSVINKTLPIMQQNLALSQNQQANQANAANAFGGSRFGVQQGVTQAQGAMGMAQMAAQLNQANFAQAQQAGEFDVNQANQMGQFNTSQANQVNLADMNAANAMSQFNAGVGNQAAQWNAAARNTAAAQNQAAGLTQEQLANQAAQGLGTLGGQQMQNNLANFGMLTTAGGFEQQQAQNDINAQMAKFQQAFTYPQQQLGMMESALGMTPYDTATSGTSASQTTQTQSDPFGAATSGLKMLGSLGSMFGIGSDRRLKTDVVKVGKHATGIPMYAYRYKGDPKHYPKVVGPMAEDVQKIAPHAVHRMTTKGHMAVDMPMLNALATPPSSPGVAKAIGMMRPSTTPGVLSANATPPSRGILGKRSPAPRAPILGALGGG